MTCSNSEDASTTSRASSAVKKPHPRVVARLALRKGARVWLTGSEDANGSFLYRMYRNRDSTIKHGEERSLRCRFLIIFHRQGACIIFLCMTCTEGYLAQCLRETHPVFHGDSSRVSWRLIQCLMETHPASHGDSSSVSWRLIQCLMQNYPVSHEDSPNVSWKRIQCLMETHLMSHGDSHRVPTDEGNHPKAETGQRVCMFV